MLGYAIGGHVYVSLCRPPCNSIQATAASATARCEVALLNQQYLLLRGDMPCPYAPCSRVPMLKCIAKALSQARDERVQELGRLLAVVQRVAGVSYVRHLRLLLTGATIGAICFAKLAQSPACCADCRWGGLFSRGLLMSPPENSVRAAQDPCKWPRMPTRSCYHAPARLKENAVRCRSFLYCTRTAPGGEVRRLAL